MNSIMQNEIIDIAFFSMVPDDKFYFDYDSDFYYKDNKEIVQFISDEFTEYLRSFWMFSFMPSIGIKLIDAYYIDGTQTWTWNWVFAIWTELIDSSLLSKYLSGKREDIEYYMLRIRIPNSQWYDPSDEEDSFNSVMATVENWWIPQCLSYVLKKDFWIVSKELIGQIQSNADWDEFLIKDPVIDEDIQYLERLDYLENFKRIWLKYEGSQEWNNTKYYYFSRVWKESFFYRMEILQLKPENRVEIEKVERHE